MTLATNSLPLSYCKMAGAPHCENIPSNASPTVAASLFASGTGLEELRENANDGQQPREALVVVLVVGEIY